MTNTRLFVIAGLLMSFALVLLVSPFANPNPDGLIRVAEDKGFAEAETDHTFGDSPLADYAVSGVDDDFISKGLSGVIGVLATFALGLALFASLPGRRRDRVPAPAGATEEDD
jgi:hypothetical protein